MTDKEKVLAKYPDACVMFCDHCIAWHAFAVGPQAVDEGIPTGYSPEEAWHAAATRLATSRGDKHE